MTGQLAHQYDPRDLDQDPDNPGVVGQEPIHREPVARPAPEPVRIERDREPRDSNPDPITGAPGSHPIGTGVGAAVAGAAAGAAGGALAGPAGAVAGAVVGAVVGGYAGKAIGEKIDPTVEDEYWRSNYASRPYIQEGADYDTYRPAYRFGWESRSRYADRRYDEVEPDLQRDWESGQQQTRLNWEQAKHAVRDAWHRPEHDPGRYQAVSCRPAGQFSDPEPR